MVFEAAGLAEFSSQGREIRRKQVQRRGLKSSRPEPREVEERPTEVTKKERPVTQKDEERAARKLRTERASRGTD